MEVANTCKDIASLTAFTEHVNYEQSQNNIKKHTKNTAASQSTEIEGKCKRQKLKSIKKFIKNWLHKY